MQIVIIIMRTLFLSTLSLRRATAAQRELDILVRVFLSTLSLRRATEDAHNGTNANLHFYPRSPCGERPRTPTTVLTLI